MNKLIIDKEKDIAIKDNSLELEITSNEVTIEIEGRVLINEIATKEDENLNLTLNISPNSTLLYNRFIVHQKNNTTITINQDDKSTVFFNYSLVSKEPGKININSNIKGNDNITEINVKAVTEEKGSLLLRSEANTFPKIKNNNMIESLKVLLLNDEETVCIPNLLVSSNEIEVNHANTISGVDESSLFYLTSKGLSTAAATNLIKDGFLLGNLEIDNETKEKMKNIIGGE